MSFFRDLIILDLIFDSSGRVSVYLSDKNLERQIRHDIQLEADILVAMAKDVPEIRKFLKKLSNDLYLAALENIKRREAKPFDLVHELQNFKNEYAKHNISIVAGYAECGSVGIELNVCRACSQALMNLTDAQKSNLKGFITACKRRGLN